MDAMRDVLTAAAPGSARRSGELQASRGRSLHRVGVLEERQMPTTRHYVCGLVMALGLGCAAELVRTPVTVTPVPVGEPRTLRVREPVSVTPSTGYTRIIRAGSTWRLVGTLPQGEVYRPIGEVFSVEGANVHEAYLVLVDGGVVGFYLPGEGAFAPLPKRVRLPTDRGAP